MYVCEEIGCSRRAPNLHSYFQGGAWLVNETRRLLRNTGIIAVGGMATKLVQFLLLPLYTSVLTTGEYGTVDYINTIALFLVPAVSLLMQESLFRFLIDCRNKDERLRVITDSCAVLGAGCAVFVAVMVIIWVVWAPDNLGWVVALVLVQNISGMASSLMRGFGDTVSYTVMNFASSLATIVLNILFIAVFRWGVAGMLSATVLAQGCTAAVFIVRKGLWRYLDPKAYSVAGAKDLIRYSVPLIPNSVSWTVMNMLDRLIIMNALGANAAGVYAVSYKFPNVMDQIYGFFYMSWKESSARALGDDEDEVVFYNAVYKALRRFMMSVVLMMTALMPLVYSLLIKGSFGEGMLYVPILLLATYFSNISGFYGGVFTAHKDTKIMGTTTVASAALCAVLCFALIPVLGLYGASIATVAATFMVNEYRRVKVGKYVDLLENRKEQALTALAVAVVFASYYAYSYTGVAAALAGCLAAALAYSLGMNFSLLKKACGLVRAKKG